MKKIALLITLLLVILGAAAFYIINQDSCDQLEPCEQYRCRNPQFYCATILYESHTSPQNIEDAQQIVLDYVNYQFGLEAEVISSSKWGGSSAWYQITCRLSDGSEYGYEVGPDGNIYEIKHLN